MANTGADIIRLCSLRMGEGEAEQLVSWLARRVEHSQALAGDRPSLERLEHVVVHWLSEGQRSALLAWLTRRAAFGEPLVPPMPRPARRA